MTLQELIINSENSLQNNPTKSKEKYKKSVDLLLEKIEFKDEKYKNIEETYKVLNCLLFSDLIDFDECWIRQMLDNITLKQAINNYIDYGFFC